MTGPHVLACMRVADMPDSGVASMRGRCGRCGMQVWIALSSPRAGKTIWCMQCTLDEAKVQTDPIEVVPPNRKQLNDLARWRRKKGS